MNTRVSQPASMASSTAYWIRGRSVIGSISLGTVLVAGRNRVPNPATGNTAVRIRRDIYTFLAVRDGNATTVCGGAASIGSAGWPTGLNSGTARVSARW